MPAPFNYGTVTGSSFQSGGDGGDPRNGLFPGQRRNNVFTHGEYDVTDYITLFAEGLYSHNRSSLDASIVPEQGAANQFTIFAGNPYIPAATVAAMTAARATSIPVGRYLAEFPPDVIDFQATTKRGVFGAKGDVFDNWHYDTSVTYGETDQNGGQLNLPKLRNLYAAADAVVSPASGQVVCRSTIYNAAGVYTPAGTGEDPGCVPLNIFGTGSASQAAINYIEGGSTKDLKLNQTVCRLQRGWRSWSGSPVRRRADQSRGRF